MLKLLLLCPFHRLHAPMLILKWAMTWRAHFIAIVMAVNVTCNNNNNNNHLMHSTRPLLTCNRIPLARTLNMIKKKKKKQFYSKVELTSETITPPIHLQVYPTSAVSFSFPGVRWASFGLSHGWLIVACYTPPCIALNIRLHYVIVHFVSLQRNIVTWVGVWVARGRVPLLL